MWWIVLADRCETDASRRQLSLQLGQLVGGGTQNNSVSSGIYSTRTLAGSVDDLGSEYASRQIGPDDHIMRYWVSCRSLPRGLTVKAGCTL